MINNTVRDALNIPNYYIDEYNATTMINFWPIIRNFAEAFNPESICEIGSERGLTSERLAKLLPNVKIHVVDPKIQDNVKKMHNVIAHEQTSKDFFRLKKNIPFYIIDGDHNYETVAMEITNAVNNAPDGPFCALFHDVAWPFGNRDGYYNPSYVNPHPNRDNVFLGLESDELQPGTRGFHTGKAFTLAERAGGEKNGVFKAIEDFKEQAGAQWKLHKLPIFFGLGILWNETGLSDDSKILIEKTVNAMELMSPIFSCAEANRLRLLQGLEEYKDDSWVLSREMGRVKRKILKIKNSIIRRIKT